MESHGEETLSGMGGVIGYASVSKIRDADLPTFA
jgi:hypothetical protein